MKQITLELKSNTGSILYQIDLEQMKYSSGGFDANGNQTSEDEVGDIQDPSLLAKRLYWVVLAALKEGAAGAGNPSNAQPGPLQAAGEASEPELQPESSTQEQVGFANQ